MEFFVVILIVGLFWLIIKGVLARGQSRPQPPTPPAQNLGRYSTERQPEPRVTPTMPSSTRAVWNPPGSTLEIRGHCIGGGMIYTGFHLDRVSGYGVEPALINPRLPVAAPPPNYRGEDMPYWPSYSEISPQARGVYLRWLAQGRRDTDVSIGIVFLFFYGLERRLLAEHCDVKDEERTVLMRELDRLLEIYGENWSFRNHAVQLSDLIGVSLSTAGMIDQPPPKQVRVRGETVNGCLRVALGRMAAAGKPLPADWALAWVDSDPEYYPRTPAQRCRGEFVRFFQHRYREKFGDGCVLTQNKTRNKIEYRPASASFGGPITIRIPELPDVTVLKEPIGQFRALAAQCTDELDAYSRFLGRYPDQRSSPSALALLPAELLPDHEDEQLIAVNRWLDQTVHEREPTLIDFGEMAAQWPALRPNEFGRRDALLLAQCLQKLGFGIEPDIRFGGFAPAKDGKVAIFRLSSTSPSIPSKAYSAASMMLHLAALVVGADDEVNTEEERHLEDYLTTVLDLTPGERERLHAHMHWLLAAGPGFTGIKKRLEGLSIESRSTIGHFLVGVASCDGHIAPAEINTLTKIYRVLGLDVGELYSRAHAATTEPVTVQQPGPKAPGFAVPLPRPPRGDEPVLVRIDMERVHTMRAETEKVSLLLRDIFVTEEHLPTPKQPAIVPEECILGLDVAQSAFLRRLVTKAAWSRTELELLAADHQILLEGTIDSINDAALDAGEERLVEGGESIEVNLSVGKELRL